MHEDRNSRIDRVVAEITAGLRAGHNPALLDFCNRYPDLSADIRDLFPTLVRLELARPVLEDQLSDEVSESAFWLTATGRPPLGDYRIVREIGRGGMGVVYEALQESLNRRVALKVLAPHISRNSRHVRRFEREALSAARLHHTNIVPVLGVGQDRGTHYLVMQLISGFALDEILLALQSPAETETKIVSKSVAARAMGRCLLADDFSFAPTILAAMSADVPADCSVGPEAPFQRRGPKYWRSVTRVGLQAAEALAYAHQQGVIHRDIKPSNLLVDHSGTTWIADFGLAKTMDGDDLTLTGETVGTVRYLPPERLQGRSDIRGDIYGLGATLYELVTLQPPFAASDNAFLLKQIADMDPLAPRAVDKSIPRDLETIIVKAMAKRPGNRYPTAAEMAGDLQCFLQGRPISARRTFAVERFWRWCRRRPAVAIPSAAAVLLAIVVVVGAVVATARLGYENRLAHDAERRAIAAEHARRKELFGAHLTNAHRTSATGLPGQRLDGLKAVRAAMSTLPEGEMTAERRLNLIDAAIPCLTRTDLRELFAVPEPPTELFGVEIDSAFERFAFGLPDDRGSAIDRIFGPSRRLEFRGPPDERSSLVSWRGFSRSGKWLCEILHRSSQNDSQRVRVWDVQSQRLALEWLPDHSGCVAEFNPDERHILFGSGEAVLRLYELETGELVRASPARFPCPIPRFSGDGKVLAVGSLDSDPLIVDPATWETLANLTEVGPARSLAWHPNGRTLIIGNLDGRLYSWDRSSGRGRFLLGNEDSAVQEIRFSSDGQWLAASAGAATQIRGFDHDQVQLKVVGSSPAFSPDGRQLGIVRQNQLKIHELIPAPAYMQIGSTADAAEFSSDGQWLVASGPSGIQIYSTDNLTRIGDLQLDHSGPVAFNRQRNEFLSFGTFSHVWRWPFEGTTSLRIGPPQAVVRGAFQSATVGGLQPQHQGRHAVFTADAKFVVLADYRNDRVLVADTANGKVRELAKLPGVTRVAVSSDGRWVAGITVAFKTVQVWDAIDGRLVLDLPGHFSVDFSDDGRRLAVRSIGDVVIYDTKSWRPIQTIKPVAAPVRPEAPIAFQPAGHLLAVATPARQAQLFDSDTGNMALNLSDQDSGVVTWLSFDPAGARLAVTRGGHHIAVWDLSRLQQELTSLGLVEQKFAPNRLSVSPRSPETIHIERGELPSRNDWHRYWKALALNEARQLLWPDAIHATTNSLEQVPAGDFLIRAELLVMRGEYRYRNHNWRGARDDWEAAIVLTPTMVEAARGLVRLHLMGPANVRDPRRVGPLVALVEPDSPSESALLRAIANVRLGRFNKDDVARLDEVASESEWSTIAAYFGALCWNGLGEHARATQAIEKAERHYANCSASLDEVRREELNGLRQDALRALQRGEEIEH